MESVSLADQVRDFLLEGLTSGRLRPGDRINEAELARRLGISRNPIREAISGLAQRGFLVAEPRRGHFMRVFTPEDVNDVFSFRICVESFAIRQAMPRMSKGDVDAFLALVERMIGAARELRLSELRQADMALHRRICELSGNRQTLRAHEGIDTEVQMLIAFVDLDQETPMAAALSHVPIVEAIASGDVERTVVEMERHMRQTWSRVLEIYDTARGVDGNESRRGGGRTTPEISRRARSIGAAVHGNIRT